MKLYDILKLHQDGFDVSDLVYDWGNYYPYIEEEEDYYDRVLNFIAKEVEITQYKEGWFSPCDFLTFINKYKNVFNNYLGSEEEDPEILLQVLEAIINGGISERDYKELYNNFTEEKNKWN